MSKNHAQMLKHLRVNHVRHKMKYVNEQKKKNAYRSRQVLKRLREDM